jgi:integrase/recombinase XerD
VANSQGGHDREKIYYGFLANYRSVHTRSAYQRDLKEFLAFLRDNFSAQNEFTCSHSHVVAFKEYLCQKGQGSVSGFSQSTINRKLSCLGAFYSYLFEHGYVEDIPTKRIRRFKIKKEVKTSDLSNDQVTSLFDCIDISHGPGLMHRAVLRVLFSTGMRHSEVVSLKFKNFCYENKFSVIKYIAKGGVSIVTPLSSNVLSELGEYFDWCQKNGYSMALSDYIFRPTKNPKNGNLNKKLKPSSLNYIIKKYAKLSGVKGSISVHSARATVIGNLLESGVSIDKVADFVGHKDISMTRSYNKRVTKLAESAAFLVNYSE